MKFMKQLVLFLLLLSGFQHHAAAQHIDTSQYVVLHYESDNERLQLSKNEVLKLEQLMAECISKYNVEQEEYFKKLRVKNPQIKLSNYVIDLKRYKRQFVVSSAKNGEKIVWVNCFCYVYGDWKKQIQIVDDGGNCFFNLNVNLSKSYYYDLMVNGRA